MFRIRLWVATCALVIAAAVAAGQSSAAAMFQQGLMLERAEGNVDQAIVLFERVIAEFPGDTAIVPQTLHHLAQVYEKRNDPRAFRIWSKLATDYASSPYAAEAKRKVAAGQSQGPFRVRSLGSMFSVPNRFTLSPDGRTIAWVRPGDGDELMVRVVETGQDRSLAKLSGRRVASWNWSPDGRRIWVNTRAVGSKSGPSVEHDVRLITLQGNQGKTIATAQTGTTSVFWAPDSRTLFVSLTAVNAQTTSDVRLVDAATGESRRIALPSPMAGEVAWSQDSSQLALRTVTASNQDVLHILTVASGQLRELKTPLNNGEFRINVATGMTERWTPDGRILVRQQRTPVPPATGNVQAFYWVSSTTGQATLSCANSPQLDCLRTAMPDGTRLALDKSAKRLLLIDPNSSATRRVTNGSADESTPFYYSTDGRVLMFISNPDGAQWLYAVPVDKTPVSDPIRVAPIEPGVLPILYSWTADGRAIINFYQDETDIFRVNMDRTGKAAGAPFRLTQDTLQNFRATVSPDSRAVAYQHERGIAVMAADGASERPVATLNSFGRIEWRSVDELIFQRGLSNQVSSMASLNVKTGAVQSLMDLPPVLDRWQYESSRNAILYVPAAVNGVSSIHARSLVDGNDRVLATVENKEATSISFRISPDGNLIAWDRLVGPENRRLHELHVMTIDGKDDRLLKTDTEPVGDWRSAGPYSWSPDGRFLLFDGRPGKLMVADVKSGESWPVAGAGDTDSTVWNQASWSPDGTFVVLSRNSWREDYRLIEGLTYDAVVKAMAKTR